MTTAPSLLAKPPRWVETPSLAKAEEEGRGRYQQEMTMHKPPSNSGV